MEVISQFIGNQIDEESLKKIIEYKEALIFSFIGLLRVLGINNCYSSVTGAKKDHCSGKIYKP